MKRQSKQSTSEVRSPLNVPLLLTAKESILKEPKQFIMNSWFGNRTDIVKREMEDIYHHKNAWEIPNCGTAACIAGWVIASHFKENPAQCHHKIDDIGQPGRFASKLIGLTYDLTKPLFHVENWKDRFKKMWKKTRSPAKRAIIAGKVIDDFIRRNQ